MNERELIEQKIRDLTCDLAASDYKIIKCYEYSLIGEPMPYDVAEANAERQSMRDRINELQNKVNCNE